MRLLNREAALFSTGGDSSSSPAARAREGIEMIR
jgi:hypothetical protein